MSNINKSPDQSKKIKEKTNRRFIKYFKPVLGLFILDSFFALILAAVSVGTPWVTQFITKSASNSDTQGLFMGIGILVASLIVRVASTGIVTYWGHLMGVTMEVNMRRDAVKKMHRLKMSHFDKTPTGTYISRIVTDLKDIPEFAHHGPEDFLVAVSIAAGGLTFAFLQSTIIGGVLAGIMLLGMIVIYKIRTSWRKIWVAIREHGSKMSASIGHQVEGSSEIKSFASEEFENERFSQFQKNYLKTYKRFYRFEGMFSLSTLLVMSLTTLSTLAIGGILYSNHTIKVDQLIGLTTAASLLTIPMQKFVNVYSMISRGSSSVARFYEFMDLPEEVNDNGIKAPRFKGNIEFKDVCFSYVDENNKIVNVLKNFNLKIKAGQKIALVGETGIGKSTILKLILRFYEIQEGEITIDGKNIKEFNLSSLRSELGYIQQHPTIFEDSIRNNILYGNPKANAKQIKEASKDAQMDDFISKLSNGYETIAGPRGAKLSGGQKQRVSIARVFLSNSSILLMDEATSALDNETEDKIKNSIEKLSEGKTMIVVAHRLSTIKDVDRIIVIGRGGVILEQGSHKVLMKAKGGYAALNGY